MRDAPRRAGHQAVDVVVLGLALVLAQLPLLPVFGEHAALPTVVGGVVVGAALAVLAARLRWSGTVTAAAAVVAYLATGAALAAPTTALAGVVPTTTSVTALLTGAVTVWKQVLTLDPELGVSGSLLAAPYLLGFAGAALAVSVAVRAVPRRTAAWAAVVPLVVLGVSLALGTKRTVAPVPAGLLLALVLVIWVAWRRGSLAPRRLVSLVLLGAVVTAGGALAGPLLAEQRPRFVLRDELVPPFDPLDHPSPLSSFRRFVKDWKDTELLTVRGLPEGASVRLATMDAFDGVVWNVAGAEQAEGSGRFRRVGDRIATSVRGATAHVDFEVRELPFVWLPTVGYTEHFDFTGPGALDLAGQLRYNDATGTAVLTDGLPAGARWTADVVVPPVPDDAEVGSAAAGSVRLPQPEHVPDAVSVFAAELAGTATSPVLIARSLQNGLAGRGWFSHGLTDSGDYPSLSGHGADRVTTLLTGDLMVGDSEQYASAMALMARTMGLPARVVLGFVPAEDQAGAPEISFTGDDIKAWVEVNLAGHGWVAFDPTPDESRTPREDTPQAQAQPQPQVRQPPPPPQDPVTAPEDDTEQPRAQNTDEAPPVDAGWRQVVVIAVSVGIPVLVFVLPAALVASLKRRRRLRRRTGGDGVTRVAGGWDELLDHALDLRRPPPPKATRREVAVRLAGAFAPPGGRHTPRRDTTTDRTGGAVGGVLTRLATDADAVVFGPGEPGPEHVDAYWDQVDQAVAAMRSAVPRRRRWWSRWATASLRGRRRGRGLRRGVPRV